MQNTKVRSSVTVDVEELDVVRHEVPLIEDPIVERPVFKSDLGVWWEALAAVVLLVAFWNIFRSIKVFGENTDVALFLLLAVVTVTFAAIAGRFAGKENIVRKLVGYLAIVGGFAFAVVAATTDLLPKSSLLTSAAVGLTITGWALRRLLGESIFRCISLGLFVALPIGFLNGSFLMNGFELSTKELVDQSVFWYTSALADFNDVSNLPNDAGIQFLKGDLNTAASFGNIFGLLVVLGTSLGLSVLTRQSLLVVVMTVVASCVWWIIFRSGYCLNMAISGVFDDPLNSLAMPSYVFLALLVVAGATNQCVGAIMAPIPIDPAQFEVSALTQIYNTFVSFPQLGQSHACMRADDEGNQQNAIFNDDSNRIAN